MALQNDIPSVRKGDWTRLKITIDKLRHIALGAGASPTFAGLTLTKGPLDLTGKVIVGSQTSPVDVTTTREYGFELHYSGNNYDVTGIRSRAQLVTTDTTATALGGLFQAANNDGIDAGVLMGFMAEAIGKSTANASTIATMRGGLIGTEWGALDTVTNLKTLHIRGHSMNAAGAGSFGTGYALYIENEAVGGNGQAYDAGIYFKGTNLSAGNKAFTYGIDFSGGTYGTSQINLIADGSITMVGTQVIKFDDTNYNILFGSGVFQNDEGTTNVGIGFEAGKNNDTTGGGTNGTGNIYIGNVAGKGNVSGNIGYRNLGIGNAVLTSLTSGNLNVGLGYSALNKATSGIKNFGLGWSSLFELTTGFENIGIGVQTLFNITTGDQNIAIGSESGKNLVGNQNCNTFIGYRAGYALGSGNNNLFLGYNAGRRQTTASNLLIIDSQQRADAATELTNAILYGVMAATPASQSLRINVGDLTLASTTPYQTLWNTTHEDTDGGRESRINFKGEQGVDPFEETTLVRMEASHDGTGADDKGKLVISINDGNDGDTPTQALEIGSDLLATFAGGGLFGDDVDISGELDVTGDSAFGPVSPTALTRLSISKHVTITSAGDVSNRKGIHASVQVGKTGLADYTGVVIGISTQVQLDDLNTQDWTNANAIRGFNADINTESSSAGTVVGICGYSVSANIQDAARVTNFYGYKVGTIQSFGGKLGNAYGVHIADMTAGDTLNYAIYTGAGLVHLGDDVDVDGNADVTGVYKVDSTQVVSNRGAAVADAIDAATTMARLNDLLARCRAHGLIAT